MFIDWLLQKEKGLKAYWKPVGGKSPESSFYPKQGKLYLQHSAQYPVHSSAQLMFVDQLTKSIRREWQRPLISHAQIL